MFEIFHLNVPYMRHLILGFSPSYRYIRLTQCLTQFKPFGIKRFVLGISISFKCECHIITQIQYTKNLNPGSFQLGTTVRSLKIVTMLKIGSKECRVCAVYLPCFKINLIKFINAQIHCYCSIPSLGS